LAACEDAMKTAWPTALTDPGVPKLG
jgi:hypothetical protein